MRDIFPGFNHLFVRGAGISLVGKEVLPGLLVFWRRDISVQHVLDVNAIVTIGSGHDEREQDAMGVHRKVTLSPFFFSIRRIGPDGFLGASQKTKNKAR